MLRRAYLKALLAAGSIGVLTAAVTSCAAAHAATGHAAQGGGAIGGGLAFYLASSALGAAGWVAAGLAGVGGWIGSWFFTPSAPPGAAPAGFPWGALVLGGLAFALIRAWAHYPVIMGRLWALVKAAARGLLGGRTPSGTPSDPKA